MENLDREFFGMPPDFQIADDVFYITRGRRLETDVPRLTIEEWRERVRDDPDFDLDEVYNQLNVSAGYEERWCERGRARWLRSPGTASEWFHFAPARVAYLIGGSYRGGRIARRYQRILREMGANPSLEEWLAYVSEKQDMELREDISVSKSRKRAREIGRAVWLRGDPVRDVFHYIPASVWTPISLRPGLPSDEHTEIRYVAAARIATELDCRVWRGLKEV